MMDPDVDIDTARQAATTLVASGRLAGIKEQLQQSSDAQRCQSLVQSLGQNKQLWSRDALPAFLASCFSLTDPKIQQQALASLDALNETTKPADRWRVSLAVKQGIDDQQLVRLTVYSDEQVARDAMRLLRQITSMTSKEFGAFSRDSGEARRLDRLGTIIREREKRPTGRYACMVYLDIETRTAAAGGRAATHRDVVRRSIPLASTEVVVEESDSGGFQVFADRREISLRAEERRPSHRPVSTSDEVALRINAAALLGAAVRSPDAHSEGLRGRVDLLPLSQEQACELKPDVLGSWAGELTITGGGRRTDHPVHVTSARIALEPIGS